MNIIIPILIWNKLERKNEVRKMAFFNRISIGLNCMMVQQSRTFKKICLNQPNYNQSTFESVILKTAIEPHGCFPLKLYNTVIFSAVLTFLFEML